MTASLLGLADRPIVVAPMGGGPSTPALVAAAARAGALGFLAGGYRTAEQLEAEIAAVRAATTGPFGVNLFVPGLPCPEPARLAEYLRDLEPEARALGVELGAPSWDDDAWDEKADLLVRAAPPIVSFTFGLPPAPLVTALRRRGTLVMVTATSLVEAEAAAGAGADVLCLQGSEAGAHRGSFTAAAALDGALPALELLAAVAPRVDLPLVVAGGISRPDHVARSLAAGVVGVQAGTAFLRSTESGAHPSHKAALVDPRSTGTAFTRSFSGRWARGLVNGFMLRHPEAPAAYPEINNATRPLRAAAARSADRDRMSLWAGVGHRDARDWPAADVIEWLMTAPGTTTAR